MSYLLPFDVNILISYHNNEKERVGLILKSGEIIEMENHCTDPLNGFETDGIDFIKYSGEIIATWHTHPMQNSNLSMNDKQAFLNWPDLDHYIIGTDGVSRYFIENGKVLRCDVESTFTGH